MAPGAGSCILLSRGGGDAVAIRFPEKTKVLAMGLPGATVPIKPKGEPAKATLRCAGRSCDGLIVEVVLGDRAPVIAELFATRFRLPPAGRRACRRPAAQRRPAIFARRERDATPHQALTNSLRVCYGRSQGARRRSPASASSKEVSWLPIRSPPLAVRPARARSSSARSATRTFARSLRQGLGDFLDLRGDLFIAGLVYTFIGIAAVVMTNNGPLMPFLFPIVAGVGLLGPVAAVGFYELARRREKGQEVHWFNFLDVRKRPSVDDMGIVAGLLLAIFALWLIAAGVLYAALFGWSSPTSYVAFVKDVLTTVNGWALILAGAVVGAIFGWIVLALSVVSLPLLVDCDVTASEAVSASWRAAHANKAEMIRWGLTVLVVLVLASIPLFVGLAFALPWLGYSTWHLYTRLVDRDSIPARRRRSD